MQAADNKIAALDHRHKALPEHAQLQAVQERRAQASDRARDLQVQLSDLTDEQKRADADVEQVRVRRTRDQQLIDSGGVADPKALARMVDELEALQRRVTSLEDVELEVMERLEAVENALRQTQQQVEEADAEVATLTQARDAKVAEIDEERSSVVAERHDAAVDVPQELIDLYEKLRTHKGGVAAAELRARQCGGCNLTLDASILQEITSRADDDVVRCEECGRILVRTAESGL